MKNYQIKKFDIDFSIIVVIKIMVRILCFSIMFLFLLHDAPKNSTDLQSYYYRISFIYYFLFLVIVDQYLKYSTKNVSNREMLTSNALFKLISLFKWFLLAVTVILIVLTFQIMPISWPSTTNQQILYVLTKIFPNLFGTNISFIIISMLMFYASAIVNINKNLKEEQELTI